MARQNTVHAAAAVLVVVPTYNERENLATLAPRILAQGEQFHLLVVDDDSPDGTGPLADELAAADPRVRVLHRASKGGLGPAYIAGLTTGMKRGFDYLVTMDADHSHDPADLPRLLAATHDARADVALGSRWTAGGSTRGWPLRRRVLSRGGSAYVRLVLGVDLRDATAGFKCIRASALAALEIDTIGSSGYAFNIELNYRATLRGFRIVEVPIVFTERITGASKMSGRIVAEALLRVPALRTTSLRPLADVRPLADARPT
ncbi:MAG: polyprenol monophosphomannose synthase [Candidatus Dormibacteraeota bacterium]|uniref:Polyprenol monophosphomannose synthase n=1 Tax=Candidatus Aeolococcus gillhamiae TaxID=3127015 RepID=A0A934JXZ5_9BACT|nr:polyprenol monophosphomannose synthase [Candidatus Dormibacteraeota bacterium]